MRREELLVLLTLSLVPSAGSAGVEEWCTEPEQVGDVAPGAECHAYLMLVAGVLGVAAPCWDAVPQDLPIDQWQAQRAWCEEQAHLTVCGHVPCY